tara:strand:+ start:229 stop:408 length:180 start_codon:yes stop_codon:yes gene_type:complete
VEAMQNIFQGTINHKQIDKLSLEQLRFINDVLDGKMTEQQKVKRVKKLFPKIITNNKGV